jgi:hypothetical protein
MARTSSAVLLRRRIAALTALLVVLGGATAGAAALMSGSSSPGTAAQATPTPTPTPPPELPRGGRKILPEFRVVAYYGAPQAAGLGALGIGSPDSAARKLERAAKPYARKTRPILPALELIVTVANRDPGADGMYRTRQSNAVIRRYLRAARRHKMLLILDIQPGHSDFFTETTRLERWLREPDVGLALDPEWRMPGGQVPGTVIGSVGAREVNATSAWLSQLIARRDLPDKLFLVHEFTSSMVDEAALKLRGNLDMVLNIDGFGGRAIKEAKYHEFMRTVPAGMHQGFKLFYEEDTGLMTPRQVLRLRPPPDVVVYE